ncbi:hypothetical protein BDW59DRAFT_174898 [Aspergillus cavernicola]|uniref:Uncharacterized protein n=1 Tax=Aspergillus cavernicola TaxID=176166 RepID=A0ABR4HXC9_9EURO
MSPSSKHRQSLEGSKPNTTRNVVIVSDDSESKDSPDLPVISKNRPATSKRIPATNIERHVSNPGVAKCNVVKGDNSESSMTKYKDFLNFSYPTRLAHTYIPDPLFRVYVDSIYKGKHGSDSGTFDPEGRLDGVLKFGELFEMMCGNQCAVDPLGRWGAVFFEWVTTWLLIQRDRKVYKEDLKGVYHV